VGRRAGTQFELGRIRDRLGDSRAAERHFADAATGFWELGHRDFAAGARISQARAAMVAGRYEEALAILDQMVEQFGGFPSVESMPISPVGGLSMWLWLLAKTKNRKRLYEAAGIALGLINPDRSARDHVAFGKALAWRASGADELGYTDEAVEMYQKAIAWLEQEKPDSDIDALLDDAVPRVAILLADLHRDEEASAAHRRVIERFHTRKTAAARLTVKTSKAWLRVVGH
jgi:tetratricopeptide (TPR) repeat protein